MDEYLKKINKERDEYNLYKNHYGNYDHTDHDILMSLGYVRCTDDNFLKRHSLKFLDGWHQHGSKYTPRFIHWIKPDEAIKVLSETKKYAKLSKKDLRDEVIKRLGNFKRLQKIKEINLNTFLRISDQQKRYKKITSAKIAAKTFIGSSHKEVIRYCKLEQYFNQESFRFLNPPIFDSMQEELSSMASFYETRGKLDHYRFYKDLKVLNDRKRILFICHRDSVIKACQLLGIDNPDIPRLLSSIDFFDDISAMVFDDDTPEYQLLLRRCKQLIKNESEAVDRLLLLHKYLINKINRQKHSEVEKIVYKNTLKLDLASENLKFISSPKQQRAHGRKMRHCIGSTSYVNSCIRGAYSVYEYKCPDTEEIYTFYIDNLKGRISSAKGICNSDVPTGIYNLVENILKNIITKK